MNPRKSSSLRPSGRRPADPAGEARMADGEGRVNRRGFLNFGLRGLAGIALAAGAAGSLASLAFAQSTSDPSVAHLSRWRESLPVKPVDENDPNIFTFSRLHYTSHSRVADVWDAHPEGDENVLAMLRQGTNIKVSNRPWRERVVRIDDRAAMFHHPFLFMTGEGNFVFEQGQVAMMREYFERGGFLYVDDCVVGTSGDYMYRSFLREARGIFPGEEMVPVPNDHDIYHCFYDIEGGAPWCQGQHHPPMGLFRDKRLVCFLTPGDIHCGWTGFWSVSNPPLTERCLRMGVNIVIYALTH